MFSGVRQVGLHLRGYSKAVVLWAVVAACPCFGDAVTRPAAATIPDAARADVDAFIRAQIVKQGDVREVYATLKNHAGGDAANLELLAKVAEEAGDLAQARQAWDALTKVKPDLLAAWDRLAAACEMLGDDAGAAQAFQEIIARAAETPAGIEARLHLAVILYDQAKPQEGAAALKSLLKLNKIDGKSLRMAGILAALCGDAATASELTQGARKDSEDLYGYLLAGSARMAAGDASGAAAEFEKALDKAANQREKKFARERIIAVARQSNTAGALVDRWLKQEFTSCDELFSLLTILREAKRGDEAMRLLERYAPLINAAKPGEAQSILLEAAAIAQERGEYQQAAAIYQKMIDRDPGNTQWPVALASLNLSNDEPAAADALLRKTLAAASSVAGRMSIAEAAQKLGRWDVAQEAASALEQMPGQTVSALLLQARMARERGNQERFVALLARATEAAKEPAQKLAVADTLEQSGNRKQAIALLEQISNETKNDAVQEHLAWLYEQENQLPQAYAIWQQAWRNASTPARKVGAKRRMLDLAARTGVIADVVIELEDKLAQGKASSEELSLLIDIYSEAKDSASAAEILQMFRTQAGGEVAMLWRLSELYLQCDRFGQAHQALEQLVEKDPDHAVDALRQMAVLAVERRNVADALDALDEIHRRTGQQENISSLRGGVLSHLDQHRDAAREFRRGLAAQSEQTEEWILWANAMAHAGAKDQAIARLQVLMDQTQSDEVLLVAADGLMNLESSRAALRYARRRALHKISGSPDKVFLYTLAVDLCEAVSDQKAALRVQGLSLLVAGEQRSAIAREMMNRARALRDTQAAIACGNMLLALDDQVPPQVFMEHGQLLLAERRKIEATRAFGRALSISGNEDAIARQIADIYQDAGYSRDAIVMLRELARLNETDLQLQIRTGGTLEQAGEFSPACRYYQTALDLVLRRLPTRRESETLAPSGAGTTSKDRQGRTNASSLNEFQDLFDVALEGWLASARTPELRAHMLRTVDAWARRELAQTPPGGKLSSYLRLERYALVVRRAAFALHQPDIADALDRELLKAFSADAQLAQSVVKDRVDWGMLARAQEFAAARELPDSTLRVADLLKTDLLENAAAVKGMAPEIAAALVPQLIMRGRDREAAAVIGGVLDRVERGQVMLFSTFAASAYVLGDHALTEKAILNWINQAGISLPKRAGNDSSLPLIRATWPTLPEATQARIGKQLLAAVEGASSADQPRLAVAVLKIVQSGDRSPIATDKLIQLASQQAAATQEQLADLLAVLPAEKHAEIVDGFIQPKAKTAQRALILGMIGQLSRPLSATAEDLMVKRFQEATAPRASSERTSIYATSWCRNTNRKSLLPRIARLMVKEAPEDVWILTQAAVAMQSAGIQDEAETLARRALEIMSSKAQTNRSIVAVLPNIVGVLRTAAVEKALQAAEQAKAPDAAMSRDLVRALLLARLQKTPEALAAFKSALTADPKSTEARRLLLDFLESESLLADAVDIWSVLPNDQDAAKLAERGRIFRAAAQLRRYRDAEAWMAASGPMESIQRLQLGEARGQAMEILSQLRSVLITNRREHRAYTPNIPPAQNAGGMGEFLTERGKLRRAAWELLATEASAADELLTLLEAMPPSGREVIGAQDGLVAAAKNHNQIGTVLAKINAWAKGRALTVNDRVLMLRLIREGAGNLPAELAADLDTTLLLTPTNDTAAQQSLASAYEITSAPDRALAILRWSVAMDGLGMGLSGDGVNYRLRQDSLARLLAAKGRADDIRHMLAGDQSWFLSESGASWRKVELLRSAKQYDAATAMSRELMAATPNVADPKPLLIAAGMMAVSGDQKRFEQLLLDAVLAHEKSGGGRVLDVRPALVAEKLTDSQLALVLAALKRANDQGVLAADVAVRSICLAGHACQQMNMKESAGRALALAESLSASAGEQDLWIADLARAMGDEARAARREERLLALRMLPLARAKWLIDRADKTGGAGAGNKIAVKLVAFSDDHDLLRRALQDAQSRGAEAEAAGYRARLETEKRKAMVGEN